jgi:chromosome segregation ATPase
MWSEQAQQRLNVLTRRAERHVLTLSEQQDELAQLVERLEHLEAVQLQTGMSRQTEERRALEEAIKRAETQAAALRGVATRHEELLARVRQQLAALNNERAALRADYERALR